MSGTDDLRELLNRLKDEVGPLPPPPAAKGSAMPSAGPARNIPETVERRFPRGLSGDAERVVHSSDPAWRENKETIFFGMMSALVALLGGILTGLEYLVIAGTSVFFIFSLVMVYALLVHLRPARQAVGQEFQARLDLLGRKVDSISSRPHAAATPGASGGRDPETERKIEELYSLFRSVSKAVGGTKPQ